MPDPQEIRHDNAVCPRCEGPAVHVIVHGPILPNPTRWECPVCGVLPQFDPRGMRIPYRPARRGQGDPS